MTRAHGRRAPIRRRRPEGGPARSPPAGRGQPPTRRSSTLRSVAGVASGPPCGRGTRSSPPAAEPAPAPHRRPRRAHPPPRPRRGSRNSRRGGRRWRSGPSRDPRRRGGPTVPLDSGHNRACINSDTAAAVGRGEPTIGGVGEIVNVDQAREWGGPEGEHWVANQARFEELDRAFTPVLIDAAALGPAERVLDIGCGCGQTTLLAARRAAAGSALGVDLSAPMLARAVADAAAAGVRNVRFERADVQVHPFPPAGFDLALSRFGVMFFADPVAAFTNVAAALVPGGRVVFLCWQDVAANEWVTVPATAALAHVPAPDFGSADAPGPFSLASPARITDLLSRAGFEDTQVRAIEAQM